jgi:hypothetical protein
MNQACIGAAPPVPIFLAWSARLARFSRLLLPVLLCGCATGDDRTQQFAQHSGLTSAIVQGAGFRHQVFASQGAPADVLYVFIEGDGSPWTHAGTVVARDPTPTRTLALELAVRTPHSILYLGRPCYFQVRIDAVCTPDIWTSGRYAIQVVDSMAAAVNRYAASGGFGHLVLIGYSGGGALAVLMAPHVPTTLIVITIAANLDVDAWVRHHHYLPLDGSLNPALQAPLPASIQQWHLIGERDLNVPENLNQRYFDSLSPDRIWRFSEFDHSCCWVEQWPQILARLDRAMND